MAQRKTLEQKIAELTAREEAREEARANKKAERINAKKEATQDAIASVICIGDKTLTTLFVNACKRRELITQEQVDAYLSNKTEG